jgi:hypothetical protein
VVLYTVLSVKQSGFVMSVLKDGKQWLQV